MDWPPSVTRLGPVEFYAVATACSVCTGAIIAPGSRFVAADFAACMDVMLGLRGLDANLISCGVTDGGVVWRGICKSLLLHVQQPLLDFFSLGLLTKDMVFELLYGMG